MSKLTAKEFLDKILTDGKTFEDVKNDELVWMLKEGSLTAQLYFEVEQEYIKRLHKKNDFKHMLDCEGIES